MASFYIDINERQRELVVRTNIRDMIIRTVRALDGHANYTLSAEWDQLSSTLVDVFEQLREQEVNVFRKVANSATGETS